MIHSYPAIINIVIGGVEVRFPDFKCSRKFIDLDHALDGAKEHLANLVNFLGKDIKKATSMHYIKTKDNEFIVMINFDDEEKYHSYITDRTDEWKILESQDIIE